MVKVVAFALAAFALGSVPGAAVADDAMHGHMAAMDKMMMAMHSPKSTGDADLDFAALMIAHHQAAIDMAKVELEFGKDPEIRALAEEIIAAQEKEIATMEEYRKRRGQ